MKKNIWIEIITGVLILLFVYTSFSKIFDMVYFKNDLSKQPFAKWFKDILVYTIPYAEILISALLVTERLKLLGLYLSFILMLSFTGYTIMILLHFFPYIPCGCGGVIRSLTWPQHLVFNLFFLVLIIIGIRLIKKQKISSQQKAN